MTTSTTTTTTTTTTKEDTPMTDMTTLTDDQLSKLIDAGTKAQTDAAAAAEKKTAAARTAADQALAEQARRAQAEAERIDQRTRAYDHWLINRRGWEGIRAQITTETREAERALADALAADPVAQARAHLQAVKQRENWLRGRMNDAAENLHDRLTGAAGAYANGSTTPDVSDSWMQHLAGRTVDRLTSENHQQWREQTEQIISEQINSDSESLAQIVPTAEKRAEKLHAEHTEKLSEFKEREHVEKIVQYVDDESSPFLSREVIVYRDQHTTETMTELMDPATAPLTLYTGKRHVHIDQLTAEDIRTALVNRTITEQAVQSYGLNPSR